MNNHPTGTVTFLFTDIEGSTKLAQQYPEAMPALLARHNEILNQAVESYNGFVFQVVGDSYAVSFHNANDALNTALQAQRNLHNENWNPAPIKVRMGIHTGAAQLQVDNKENIYSGYATLAMTQRIMSAGHGGQILLSPVTEELIHNELPEGVELTDRGEWQLKDVIRPMHIYQLVILGLPADFSPLRSTLVVTLPGEETTSLLDRVVRGKLVGRERELADANLCWQRAIAGEGQILLVSGEPGVGKTRFTHELLTRAKFSGSTVLTGECYAEGGSPYAPVAQIIQDAFSQNPTLLNTLPQYVLADLLAITPSLRARYADKLSNPLMDKQSEKEQIYDSIFELFTHLSVRTPVPCKNLIPSNLL